MSVNPPHDPHDGPHEGSDPSQPQSPQNPPGNYPPPPGNYPPPPGNYPPPPGNYPPPPGGVESAGHGDAVHGRGLPSALSVGDAVSFGWNTFKNNAGVWVLVAVVAAAIQIVLNSVFGGFGESSDLSDAFGVWRLVGTLITAVVGYLINAALIRGALHEIDGNKPTIGSFFQFGNVVAIILASVLVGIMVTVGFVLLIIPGIVLAFLTWWTLQFVVDRNDDAITAIKSSIRAISSNAGTLILLALALVGINILGAIPCGLGLLVTIPMTIIASTYAYRIVTRNAPA